MSPDPAPTEEWSKRAACLGAEPDTFFPEKGGSTREAKRICSGCLVRDECLDFALANAERFGIWGGMSERERRKLSSRPIIPRPQRQAKCGTTGGYQRHRRNGEPSCGPCRAANAQYQRDRSDEQRTA